MEAIQILEGTEIIGPLEMDLAWLSAEVETAPFFNIAILLATEFAKAGERMIRESSSRPGRNEGILRGLVVRTIKLLDRLVAESCDHHGEMTFLLGRPLLEAWINIAWLIQGPAERFDAYAWDGMITPRLRRQTIRRNIAARGNVVLPIEDRQLSAIESEATLAGVDLDVAQKERPRLPALEIRVKSAFVTGDLVYDFSYRMGSGAVHGNWKDLLDRHVTSDGRYEPIFAWRDSDPSPLLGEVIIGSGVLGRLADFYGFQNTFGVWFTSIFNRALETNRLYGVLYESRPATGCSPAP